MGSQSSIFFLYVFFPPKKPIVRCKWVYKIKILLDDPVKCYKTHLVAKEFSRIWLDLEETFALVALLYSMALSSQSCFLVYCLVFSGQRLSQVNSKSFDCILGIQDKKHALPYKSLANQKLHYIQLLFLPPIREKHLPLPSILPSIGYLHLQVSRCVLYSFLT